MTDEHVIDFYEPHKFMNILQLNDKDTKYSNDNVYMCGCGLPLMFRCMSNAVEWYVGVYIQMYICVFLVVARVSVCVGVASSVREFIQKSFVLLTAEFYCTQWRRKVIAEWWRSENGKKFT